ncbi:MAG TPA: prepilin-type N-terminal cleavage/methylation domain-containing protein [Persephonella sp.]|nr:prepilin-type N-terminal cleavage/methylation domain-containing protein [Persephonella sp.]
MKESQKGFTLVELAIVLVIIGIILGAVLKGQELIKNAKEKRLYNTYREMIAAINTYLDRYNALPGDDPRASSRWSGQPDGNGNGQIAGLNFGCTNTTAQESCYLWQHLRVSGIISGDSNDRRNINHPFGGKVGVGWATFHGLTDHWIGFQNIPEDIALSIDEKYDDGVYNTGSIRASGSTNYNLSDTADALRNLYFRGF